MRTPAATTTPLTLTTPAATRATTASATKGTWPNGSRRPWPCSPRSWAAPSQPLEVGRSSRVVQAAQRAALAVRDGG
jgi:hypothetical protein